MNVLAVGCHPDDIEILCAGTLALCRRRGDRVTMCAVMNGRHGHRTIPPDRLALVREREMRASARVIGASVIWPNLDGPYVADDPPTRDLIVDLVREARADLVISHAPECYHPNHRAIGRLVWDAVFTASLPHVKTRFPHVRRVPALVHMDTIAGVNFQPTEYVDVSGVIGVKKRMLRKHRSQFAWLKSHVKQDVLDFMVTQTRFRGYQAGVRFAEGFRAVLNYPLARTRRLLP